MNILLKNFSRKFKFKFSPPYRKQTSLFNKIKKQIKGKNFILVKNIVRIILVYSCIIR